MGIESISGTCQGKPWEVPLNMDFGNNIWKNREVKIMHGEKSFLPDERKVVELLNQFDHKVSKVLRKIYWFESNSNQLETIRHCFDKVYKKADQLNEYAGGSLVLKDLFRLRLGKIFSYGERINIGNIRDKMEQSLWPEIKQSSVQSGAMREEDLYNLHLMETEINDYLDWRPQESVAQENDPSMLIESEMQIQEADQDLDRSNSIEPPMLVFTENFRQEIQQRLNRSNTAGNQRSDHDSPDVLQARRLEEAERLFESLTNLTFQGDQGEKEK